MKFFIIACEPSGDLHGAHLIEEIKRRSPGSEFRGLGGPAMAARNVHLLEDMTKFSALGLGDVLRQYLKYREIFYRALNDVETWKPDALILIDSPAFNLRFAKKIKKRFPVIYYISPQIWAWGSRRIHTIKKTVSKMITILPFEVEVYKKVDLPCEFVGHPLLDEIHFTETRATLRGKLSLKTEETAVGILSGSRAKEVKRILPDMLESARQLKKLKPSCRFFLSRSANVPSEIYDGILARYKDLQIETPQLRMHDLLLALDFAFITSGTATLEATLIGTPFFLFYRASWSTYVLGKMLIEVKFLGLVNLLASKSVVPEFIQNEIHPETIAHESKILLETPALYQQMKSEFAAVKMKLGQSGASQRAAAAVLNFIERK